MVIESPPTACALICDDFNIALPNMHGRCTPQPPRPRVRREAREVPGSAVRRLDDTSAKLALARPVLQKSSCPHVGDRKEADNDIWLAAAESAQKSCQKGDPPFLEQRERNVRTRRANGYILRNGYIIRILIECVDVFEDMVIGSTVNPATGMRCSVSMQRRHPHPGEAVMLPPDRPS
jgi:hypothetical protein